MTDTSIVPPPVDPNEPPVADKAAIKGYLSRHQADLATAQQQRAGISQQRRDVTAETLKAIDDATESLKAAHSSGGGGSMGSAGWAALAAGLLGAGRPQGGGFAPDFFSDFGRGLGAAAPYMEKGQMRDEDFWRRIAELKAQRGDIELKPVEADAKAAAEREKAAADTVKALEVADIRTVSQADRLAQTQDKDRAAALLKLQQDARKYVDDTLKDKEQPTIEAKEAMIQQELARRIDAHNAATGDRLKLPTITITDEQKALIEGAKSSQQKKNEEEQTRAWVSKERTSVESSLKGTTPGWEMLSPEQREALIKADLYKRATQMGGAGGQPIKLDMLKPNETDQAHIDAATAATNTVKHLGEPDKKTIEAAGLPVNGLPSNKYAGRDYKGRVDIENDERAAAERNVFKDLRNASASLAKTEESSKILMNAFNATPWYQSGYVGGIAPAITPESQLVDKFVAEMTMTNVPKGQGQVSDNERALLAKSNPSRRMTSEAFKTLVDIRRAAIQRDNDELAFMTTWMNTHKTLDGAQTAWNRYINSNEGSVVTVGKDGTTSVNQNRQSWQTYFGRENGKKTGRIVDGKYVED